MATSPRNCPKAPPPFTKHEWAFHGVCCFCGASIPPDEANALIEDAIRRVRPSGEETARMLRALRRDENA